MKKISHLAIFATIFMISCQNTNKISSQRFSTKLDTFYKYNSTDIEKIIRTIYQYGSYENGKMISLESGQFGYGFENGQTVYGLGMILLDTATFPISTVVPFSIPEFKKFIKDARTVSSGPHNKLHFYFGENIEGTISSGIDKGTINLLVKGTYTLFNKDDRTLKYSDSHEPTIDFDIAIAEVDSMESCYNRFLSEKK